MIGELMNVLRGQTVKQLRKKVQLLARMLS